MGIQNQALLSLSSVKAFRDYSVKLGVVVVTDDELVKYLDDTYAEVTVCGLNVKPGGALLQLSAPMFYRIKGEYQAELQADLQSQLVQGNDVDITFHV